MHKNDRNNHLDKKCCPKFPVKLPHTKYRENKKYACFCAKLFDFMNTEGSSTSTVHVQCSTHRIGCLESMEKATQNELDRKNIYDAYILDGLLNTDSPIDKTYVKLNNSDSIICENKSLSDIKQLLLTTNDKLDIILRKLMEKSKPKKLKPNKRKQNTISELTLCPKQNGLLDLPNLMNIRTNYANTNPFTQSKIKECAGSSCSIYPYNTAYYLYGTNTNYLKALGAKYSEEEIATGLWNPFLFMASNIHASKLLNSSQRISNPGITFKGTVDFKDMEQFSCDQD